ncbi:MAG: DUF1566 domain-containing protein [Treponema sp.]|nr:DUF1566 domain-containing protein [Treponema sp.]
MKKVIKTLGIIAILVVIGFAMLACDGDPKCTHGSWGNWTQVSFGRETRKCNDCTAVQARLTRNIGETGEAGGRIFYRNANGFTLQDDNPVNNKTVYYLEAWTTNETDSEWGDFGTLVPSMTNFTSLSASEATVIGNGRRNTQRIAAHMTGKSIANTAAQRCLSATHGTKTDWFLPSLGELNELYKAKGHTNVPTSGYFWSSSQYSSYGAWGQNFGNGLQFVVDKSYVSNVRAVRAF